MLPFIKIPQGSFKRSKIMGCLNEFLFYSSIKRINIHGVLNRGEVIQKIKDITDLSESNIRSKIAKLKKIGWIDVFKNGSISIKKYDVVWEFLGIKKTGGDGLKIFKIKNGNSVKELRDNIHFEEIKHNLKSQHRKMVQSYFIKIGLGDTEKKPNNSSRIKKKLLKRVNFDKLYLKEVKKHSRLKSDINYDVSLSCIGVSKLLGYTSAMQGYFIERQLMKLKKIDIKRRFSYFTQGNFNDLPNSFFRGKNNSIVRQLPNKITIC